MAELAGRDLDAGALADLTEVLELAVLEGHLGGRASVRSHIEHAAAFGRLIHARPDQLWADLGTGAGVPGLILAWQYPDVRWVLVDRADSRAGFVDRAVRRLQLDNVEIVVADATVLGRDPGHRQAYHGVVARAFAAPGVLAECASPLLAVDGLLVVSEPPDDGSGGGRWPGGDLPVGLRLITREAGPPAFVVLRQETACPDRFPRRWPAIRRAPVF